MFYWHLWDKTRGLLQDTGRGKASRKGGEGNARQAQRRGALWHLETLPFLWHSAAVQPFITAQDKSLSDTTGCRTATKPCTFPLLLHKQHSHGGQAPKYVCGLRPGSRVSVLSPDPLPKWLPSQQELINKASFGTLKNQTQSGTFLFHH